MCKLTEITSEVLHFNASIRNLFVPLVQTIVECKSSHSPRSVKFPGRRCRDDVSQTPHSGDQFRSFSSTLLFLSPLHDPYPSRLSAKPVAAHIEPGVTAHWPIVVDMNKQVVHSRPAVEAQWSLVASPKDTLKMKSDVALGEELTGRWD